MPSAIFNFDLEHFGCSESQDTVGTYWLFAHYILFIYFSLSHCVSSHKLAVHLLIYHARALYSLPKGQGPWVFHRSSEHNCMIALVSHRCFTADFGFWILSVCNCCDTTRNLIDADLLRHECEWEGVKVAESILVSWTQKVWRRALLFFHGGYKLQQQFQFVFVCVGVCMCMSDD